MDVKTILVVDDQPEIIQRVAMELHQKGGYKVINASNGEIAVKIAQEEKPDVILMDWDMPVMNGVEAAKKLKSIETTYEIPIVIMTGQMTSSEDLKVALDAGTEDYVRKPIDFVELLARVRTALRMKEQHNAINQFLKNEIELKNRKLSSTSMLIVEKNSILQDFYNELDELGVVMNNPQRASEKLEQLKKQIQHQINIDSSWDTFKLHFDEVHPQFFENIKQQSPDISHKDLKLCAYIKLGLENKEIANLLNISPASVSTALFRLKKKLNMSENTNLREAVVEF